MHKENVVDSANMDIQYKTVREIWASEKNKTTQ